ncbi:MAG: tryptophan synthase subunit alpha [Thaumarchaeota archaeon]|nr:tryptophan synthase subunit alpha [Candidatus Calditenuaceae archaeon]MDW8186578.1 tryptophan synthase subunit alpha [Nitrososphaerota archaeon]
MRELVEAFDRARSEKRAAFIGYLTGGYPDAERCFEALVAMAEEGVDVLEVGIPFSDPIADGATIQEATSAALRNGTRPSDVIALIGRVSKETSVPVVLLSYLNVILRYGVDRFAVEARASGASAVIVPDLPLEESTTIGQKLRRWGLGLVLLASPTTGDIRLSKVLDQSDCFTYLVSVTGITGERTEVPRSAIELIRRAKSLRPLARVAVGFGVSSPQHGRRLASEGADGVVVGSKIVSLMREGGTAAVRDFAKQFRSSLFRESS